MLKVGLTLLLAAAAAACAGDDEGVSPPGSPTPTPPPCAGTPIPSAANHDIEFPRVGGDYTRQVPIEAFVADPAGSSINVEILTLDGGLLGSGRLTVGGARRGDFHKVDDIFVIQAIPDKTRACAVIEGQGWRAEIPVRVGGASP
jgi:hypothetical protein